MKFVKEVIWQFLLHLKSVAAIPYDRKKLQKLTQIALWMKQKLSSNSSWSTSWTRYWIMPQIMPPT